MSFSNYLEAKVLDHIVGKTSFTMPTAYVGLSTANPDEDASGNAEPSGNGYARVATDGDDWNATGVDGETENANAITFPTAEGAWGTITHFTIWDAATDGNMLAYGELDTPTAITTNQIPRFAAGAFVITLD
jgi:hypothetical protein